MSITIETTADIAKSFSCKREKRGDDTEAVIGHLKFTGALVSRETIDEFCGQAIGWAQDSLFDWQGAPAARFEISLTDFAAQLSGVIRRPSEKEVLKLADAKLSNVSLALTYKGALLSGELAWEIAGDESADTEPLLGRLCAIHFVVLANQQQDLLKPRAA